MTIKKMTAVLAIVEAHLRQQARSAATAKGRAQVEQLLRKRWKQQQRDILKHNTLRNLSPHESVPPEVTALILRALLPGAIQHTLQGLVSDAEVEMFAGSLRVAFRNGAKVSADELSSVLSRVHTGNAEEAWIRSHGFEKLARDIDRVTVERLKNHVGEVYIRGGSYRDMVRAIKDTFAGFTEERAELIATTELNAAYNQGGLEFAKGVGAQTKSWNPLGTNVCPICRANQGQGSIPVHGAFQSGAEAPPQHPRCNCVLDFGFIVA